MNTEIYRRDKKAVAYQTGPDEVMIKVSFQDGVHEMNLNIMFRVSTREIIEARAAMLRTPYDICKEVEPKVHQLVGVRVAGGVIAKVSGIVGGPGGCSHLADLAVEAIRSFIQARFRVLYHRLPGEEKVEKLKEENKGFCHTYNNLHRNPRRLLGDDDA